MIQFFLDEMNSDPHDDPELRFLYQKSLSNLCVVPSKVLKVMTQLQGKVEICIREAPDAFVRREKEELLMLQYPQPADRLYEEIVREKVNFVRQERASNTIIEGARRRMSMLVEGVLDPDLYLAAMTDFIYTITSTMRLELRPMQASGAQGQLCAFEEGILCQRSNVYPGLEAKLTTGSDETSCGWFAAILAVMRRLIMKKNTFGGDFNTTMMKTSINVLNVDEDKANVILKALKNYLDTTTNNNISRRQQCPAGKIVNDYIIEAAALIKRLFMARTERRLTKAIAKFENPLEMDRCFVRLNGHMKKAVLRFCKNCNYSKSSLFTLSLYTFYLN